MSSEESSTYPDESDMDLGLGLSLGRGDGRKSKMKPAAALAGGGGWDHQSARIFTAEDFQSVLSTKASSTSSASSSSSSVNNNDSCGFKRTVELPSSPPGCSSVSQVIGWPPVRCNRMNSLVNHAKSPVTEDFSSTVDECKRNNVILNEASRNGNTNDILPNEKGPHKTSLFVKVNRDGIPIGRKVDVSAHRSYDTLVQALDDMFKLSTAMGTRRSHLKENIVQRHPLKLLDCSSSDFVLTYEDKDGDWMLVGDVPWKFFVNSVKRLRIMRTAKANGLGSHGRNRKPGQY